MKEDNRELQHGAAHNNLRETITQLGLEYRLMTPFTSFVAVEEMIVTDNGQPLRVDVPVETPAGVGLRGDNPSISGGSALDNLYIADGVNLNDQLYENIPVQRSTSSLFYLSAGKAGGSAASGADSKAVSGRIEKESISNAESTVLVESTDRSGESGGSKPKTEERSADKSNEQSAPLVTPEEQKRRQILAKLHPSIAALIQRLKDQKAQPGATEAAFVRDDQAMIQVWLTDTSPEAVEQLKQLGFEVLLDPKSTKLVIGRIALRKLEALAELKQVRYLAPQVTK
jgi:hypothetical protein